jgi:uncharacterized membrane protein YphA (DoxX/SURF4 family)
MSNALPRQGNRMNTDEQQPAPTPWNPLQKIAVRFAAIYFSLWFVPMLLTAVPEAIAAALPKLFPWEEALGKFDQKVQDIWLPLDNFFARTFFHVDKPIVSVQSGSGDKLVDYMNVFTFLVIAVLGTVVWSIVDRKRRDYSAVYEYLRVVLRYSLAIILMSYGFAKTTQFPSLRGVQLMGAFGNETPMGMLWNFMGASLGYSIFSGILETMGGFLLLFRRTTTLSAGLAAAVMLNVFMLNIFYDVPVKIASFHYLVCAIILILPDLGRLLDVLILNRPTTPRQLIPSVKRPVVRIAVLSLKWVFVAALVYGNVAAANKGLQDRLAARMPLEGVWKVSSFKQNGVELDPVSISNPVRWQKISIDNFYGNEMVFFEFVGGTRTGVPATDDQRGILTLKTAEGPRLWQYHLDGTDHLMMEGALKGVPTSVDLQRIDTKYMLTNHKIHWIQERPRTP